MRDCENLMYAVAKYTAQATRQEITLEELHETLKLIVKEFDKLGAWK